MEKFLNTWSPRILSILRIVTGFLFLWHGTQKLFSFPSPMPLPPGSEAPPFAFVIFVGTMELLGGLLIVVGLSTRPVAFILSGMMAVAYFSAHAVNGFLPIANGGEPAALYSFIFLYLAFAGGGAWALDNSLRNSGPTGVSK
ncbi:MAG: DoxX family protein [Acidobacteria bacterium]|nr:DoxX family protein [Acidobacteriota bacterium]